MAAAETGKQSKALLLLWPGFTFLFNCLSISFRYDRGGRKSPRDAKPYRQRTGKPVNADALSLEGNQIQFDIFPKD